MKAEFLAEMTHELRSPLNTILGFAELMHDGSVGPIAEDHKEYLGDILTSGRQLLRMIEHLLDIARLEAGRAMPSLEPIDLAAHVDGARTLVQGRAAHKHIQIRIEIPDATEIIHDPVLLRQIAFDALSNAVNVTPDGGSVVVHVKSEGSEFEMAVEALNADHVRTAKFTAVLPRLMVTA